LRVHRPAAAYADRRQHTQTGGRKAAERQRQSMDDRTKQERKRPAVFLDRDGTLMRDVGIVRRPEQIELYPDVGPALRMLSSVYELFVVTNQGGISKGLLTLEEAERVNRELSRQLLTFGVTVRQWYVCPHLREDGCDCIKPSSFFLREAAEKYSLDLRTSFFIGDHPHDAATGADEGVFGLCLLTGHGFKHLAELPPQVPVFHSLLDAAEWIIAHPDAEHALDRDLRRGAEAIAEGKLAAFPTETVYGLGGDALNPAAAARIFAAKQRPLYDPLIVHIAAPEELETLTAEVPQTAWKLIERFWPGPLTLVLPKSPRVPDIVTASKPTVAVRMPAHPLALELIRRAAVPVAAPSANLFGRTSPTTARHVEEQLAGRYEVLIDGGACRVGVESTVLLLTGRTPQILRPGGVSAEELEAVIGRVEFPRETSGEREHQSPGMLPSHYAPQTPLVLTDDPLSYAADERTALIVREPVAAAYPGNVFVLGAAGGGLKEAAAQLYRILRLVDQMQFRLIAAQRFPDTGIGAAVNDRLTRAAAR
jgi:L-threonylcarbamoyladenylate synthase